MSCVKLSNQFINILFFIFTITLSVLISKDVISPYEVLADPLCYPGYSYNASAERCETAPICESGQYDYNSQAIRCISTPSFACISEEYVLNLDYSRCEKFTPDCPCGGTYDFDLGACTAGNGPACPCDYGYVWTEKICLRAPICHDGGTVTGIGGNLEMCTSGIDVTCPSGFFYSSSEKICYNLEVTCPKGGGLNTADDVCVSTFACTSGETCGDGMDNNCNEQTDEGCPNEDLDNDDYYSNDNDCDDNDSAVYEGAPELCDGKDNNCDGNTDEICVGEDNVCVDKPNSTEIGSSANFASGNLFHEQRVSGADRTGLIKIDIAYNSLDPVAGPFGRGWTHSYNSHIDDYGDTIVFTEKDGRSVYYYKSGSTYYPDPVSGRHSSIKKNADSTYTLTEKSGVKYDYNTDGSLTKITDRNSNIISFSYTGDDLTSITDASGRITTLAYTANQITSITDPGGRTTSFTYNNDELSSVTDPMGGTWTYTYDTEGRMLTKTDPLGHTTTYAYNAEGRITSSIDAESNTKTISYDQTGRIAYVTEKNGSQWTYEYDSVLNVPLKITDPNGNFTTYEYDPERNLLSETDPDGNRTSYKYDANGNRTKVISAIGRVISYTYNSYGQITQIADPDGNTKKYTYHYSRGNLTYEYNEDNKMKMHTYGTHGERLSTRDFKYKTTTFTYDQYGNLASVTNPLNQTVTYTYDVMGNLLTKTDPNGNTTTYEYDLDDRLISKTGPDDGVVEYEYNLKGNVTKFTDANGNETSFIYDNMDRLTKITDYSGNSMNFTVDAEGNITSMTVKDSSETVLTSATYTYDSFNRPIKATNSDATFSEWGYDNRGNITSGKDENGNTSTFTYDALNRLLTVTDPEGGVTSYTYDARNNLLSVIDGNETAYVYDKVGRLILTTSPDTGTATYKYDANSNMTERMDAEGVRTTYTYDFINRVTAAKFPDTSQNITYAYDNAQYQNSKGRLTTMTDPSGTTSYDYDSMGRIMKVTRVINSVNYITEYSYDLNGNLLTAIYPGGRIITNTYNQLNRITKVEETIGAVTSTLAENIAYLPHGDITSMTYGNGIVTARTYDNRYRLSGLTAGTLKNLTYTSDNIGNITDVIDTLDPAKNKSYTYDATQSLVQAAGPWGTLSFGYGLSGNRISETTDTGSTVYSYAVNTNKLTSATGEKAISFSYDNNGNTIVEDTKQYIYNQNQRLTQVVEAGNVLGEYVYDGQGRRVSKTTQNGSQTVIYHYSKHGLLISESTPSGTITAEYVYLNGNPLAKIEGSDVYYYHNDHLGTPMLMTDETQSIVWQGEHLPFGKEHSVTGSITNNLRFPGQYYDAETGMNYNYFRNYNPMIGRYVEADPIGIEQGMNHLYGYVQNNPVNFSDPWGLESIIDWDIPEMPHQPLPGYNYCGPGSLPSRSPSNRLDDACRSHDNCYESAGMSSEDVDICDPGQDTGPSNQDICDDALCRATNTAGGWIRPGVRYLFCD